MATGFEQLLGSTKGSGVSVRKMMGASNDSGNEKLQAIGDMFVKAQKEVLSDQSKLADKGTLGALNKLDRRFTDYANNIGDLSVLMEKFVDPNYTMNKKEAQSMNELLASNTSIVKGLADRTEEDDVFRKELEGVQKEQDFLFRNKGVIDEDQAKLEKRFNTDMSGLWSTIGENIADLSTNVMSDLSDNLIDGIGGPFVMATRQILLPLLMQAKDSKLGQLVAGGLGKMGDRIKGIFGGGSNDGGGNLEVDELVAGIQEGMSEELDDLAEELIVPDQSDIRKKFVRESRVKEPLEKGKSNKGIYKQMYQVQEKSSVLLTDILNTLRGNASETGDVTEALVMANAVQADLASKSQDEISQLNENSELAAMYLIDLLDETKLGNASADLIAQLSEQTYQDQTAVWEVEDDFRDQLLLMLTNVLDGLEDIVDKSGSGGGGLLSSLIPLLGGGLLAGGLTIGKRHEARVQAEEDTLIDKRMKLAKLEGTVVGQKLEQAMAAEEEADTSRLGTLSEKEASVGSSAITKAEQKELDELRAIIAERKLAEAEVIKSLYGKGTTEEGNTVVDFEDLMSLENISSKDQLKELLDVGNISVSGKTKAFGKEQEEIIDIDESMKGISRFGRAAGINIDEVFRKRLEAQTGMKSGKSAIGDFITGQSTAEADTFQNNATGGVYDSESIVRLAEAGKEAVVPLDDYVISAPSEGVPREIEALEREIAQQSAERGMNRNIPTAAPSRGKSGVLPPMGGRTTKSIVSLAEIPIITDNLGLILINSGKIFT